MAETNRTLRRAWQSRERWTWIYCALAIAVMASAMGALLWSNRRSVLAEAEREVAKDARALERHTALAFGTIAANVATILQGISHADLDANDADAVVREEILAGSGGLEQVYRTAVIVPGRDPQSHRVVFARHPGVEFERLFAAEHLLAQHRLDATRTIIVGSPVRHPAHDRFLIPISRPLYAPDGTVRAVGVSFVDPAAYAGIYKAFKVGGNGVLAVFRDDGIMLAREPHDPRRIGESLAQASLFAVQLKRGSTGTYRSIAGIDGVDRVVSFTRVQGLPMVAAVGRAVSDILAPWRVTLIEFSITFLFVSGILIVVVHLYVRQQQRGTAAELARRSSEAQLRSLIAAVPGVVFQRRMTADGRIDFTFVSDRAREIYGLDPAVLTGESDSFVRVMRNEDQRALRHALRRSAENLEILDREHLIVPPSGEDHWIHTVSVPRRVANGVVLWDGIAVDVTREKRQREALEESESHLRSILERGYDAVVSVLADGRIREWSARAEGIFGWTADEAIGRLLLDLVVPELSRPEHAQRIAKLTGADPDRRIPERGEGQLMRRGGEYVPCEFAAVASRRHGEAVATYLIRDVSERQALEAQSRAAQRMAAIGQLTGGVAHEFNNLLTAISGNAELISMKADGDLRAMAERIERAAQRGSDLTYSLLAFSRRQPLQPHQFAAHRVLSDVERLARPLLGVDVALEVEQANEADLPVNIDEGQFQSALLNLVINARDAMPGGGTIRMVAEACLVGASSAKQFGILPGEYVRVSVTDNGTGMTPEVQQRAFEPFFSTKDVGKGTGLGLSMVHGFMTQSGGAARIESEVGQGTTVMLLIPRALAAPQAAVIRQLAAHAAGPQTVLMVEDDVDVLTAGSALLRSLGYFVTEAADGPAAIEAASRLDRLDVLFADVVLPKGVGGRSVAEAIRRKFPNVPVVFTSGYNDDTALHEGEPGVGAVLLGKPYTIAELVEAFATAAAARDSRPQTIAHA